MFRHQLSRLTSYTFKYAGMGTPLSSSHQDPLPSPQLIEFWVAEAQRGLDALLNDQFDQADSILSQHAAVSPFHAVAYALMAYVEAMLAFDVEKIRIASARIAAAEDLARQYGRRVRKRGWNGNSAASFATSTSAAAPPSTLPGDDDDDDDSNQQQHEVSIAFDDDGAEKIMISDDSASCTTTSSSSMESVMTAPEEQQQQHHHQKPSPTATTTTTPSITTKNVRRTFDLQCELLEINCILMGATTQFMGNSWLEYMKATYRLRKSYKMYEHMFTNLTGQKPSECAAMLKRRKKSEPSSSNKTSVTGTATRPLSLNNNNNNTRTAAEKRFSLFNLPTGVTRKPSSIRSWDSRRRLSLASSTTTTTTTTTTTNTTCNNDAADIDSNGEKHDSTVESGVFFGIGLFSLIFSLLPPKVNKILNTLGFHSSRPFALHVLQKSYQSRGLYSSLSALTLLVYFTNLSLFIHPRLLPNSMTRETTRAMLNDMKTKYPNSKIWELLEGKLCKMEGKSRKGVEILRDARRRHSIRVDLGGGTKKWVNEVPRDKQQKQHTSATSSTSSPDQQQQKKSRMVVSELAQLQGLAVYEMGWAQVFLGDYFQASETFFRLESMNNWSRAFYHYIATCCMFADEQYDKAGMEFQQIPSILDRKRQLGGRLLPNEMFAERKIKRWKEKAHMIISQGTYLPPHLQWMTQPQTQQQQEYMKERYLLLDGELLKQVVVVNPLWELIYLWNGIPQLSTEMLGTMKHQLQSTVDQQHSPPQQHSSHLPSDLAILRVILGAVLRELGDFDPAEKCFQATIAMDIQLYEDRWVIPYAMYELAVLNCFRIQQNPDENSDRVPEIRSLIKRAEHYFHAARRNNENNASTTTNSPPSNNNNKKDESSNDDTTDNAPPVVDEGDYHDWESRLHIRCQLLMEKLDELQLLITTSPTTSIPID